MVRASQGVVSQGVVSRGVVSQRVVSRSARYRVRPLTACRVALACACFATLLAFRAEPAEAMTPPEIRVAATVFVHALPRSVELVSVPLPRELADGDSVAFRVNRTPGFSIAGPSQGMLSGTGGRVLLSVAVPSHALAGRVRVADVHFIAPGASELVIIVPVELVVLPVRQVSVAASVAQALVLQGRRADVLLTITNAGNVEDTVQLDAVAPAGWRARLKDAQAVVLAAGTSTTRALELIAPRDHVPGSSMLDRAPPSPARRRHGRGSGAARAAGAGHAHGARGRVRSAARRQLQRRRAVGAGGAGQLRAHARRAARGRRDRQRVLDAARRLRHAGNRTRGRRAALPRRAADTRPLAAARRHRLGGLR